MYIVYLVLTTTGNNCFIHKKGNNCFKNLNFFEALVIGVLSYRFTRLIKRFMTMFFVSGEKKKSVIKNDGLLNPKSIHKNY